MIIQNILPSLILQTNQVHSCLYLISFEIYSSFLPTDRRTVSFFRYVLLVNNILQIPPFNNICFQDLEDLEAQRTDLHTLDRIQNVQNFLRYKIKYSQNLVFLQLSMDFTIQEFIDYVYIHKDIEINLFKLMF